MVLKEAESVVARCEAEWDRFEMRTEALKPHLDGAAQKSEAARLTNRLVMARKVAASARANFESTGVTEKVRDD